MRNKEQHEGKGKGWTCNIRNSIIMDVGVSTQGESPQGGRGGTPHFLRVDYQLLHRHWREPRSTIFQINTTSLASSYYHPMMSVEISELGTSGSCRYTSSTGAHSYLSDTRSVISTDNHPLIISKLNMSIKIPVTIVHHIFTATKSASVSISSLMVCLFE